MKKFLTVILLLSVLMSVFVLSACDKKDVAYQEELLKSGNFESSSASSYWTSSYLNSSSNAPQIVSGSAEGEEHFSNQRLQNKSADYTYVSQKFAVEDGGVYKLSVDIKLVSLSESGEKNGGATVCLKENTEDILISVTDTDNVWHTYTVYFKSKNLENKNSGYATVLLRMGTDVASFIGEARYDNISIERVESAPEGVSVVRIKQYVEKNSESSVSGILYMVILALATLALMIAVYCVIRRLLQHEAVTGEDKSFFNSAPATVLVILLIGFLIRFIMSLFVFNDSAYTHALVDNVKAVASLKFAEFYTSDSVTAGAPGYMLTEWIIGKIAAALSVTEYQGYGILIKAPAILADIVTIFCVYYFARKYASEKVSAIYALVYAVLPVAFTVASVSSFEASLIVMLFVLTFMFLLERKFVPMFAVYFVAVYFSELALYALPFVLTYAIYIFVKECQGDNKSWGVRATIIVGVVGSFLLLFAATLPMTLAKVKTGGVFEFLKIYYDQAFGSQVCVDNNYSLYAIFGLNQKTVNTASNVLNILFIVVLIAYSILLYFKNRNRSELMLLASFFIVGVSTFCLNRNETSMFIGLALLLMYIVTSGEKRLYFVFAALSTISFVNVAQFSDVVGAFVSGGNIYNIYAKNALFIIGSIFAVVAVIYYGYLVYKITVDGERKELTPMQNKPWITFKAWVRYLAGKDNFIE